MAVAVVAKEGGNESGGGDRVEAVALVAVRAEMRLATCLKAE